jgi:CO/xanthine dehydrogenase Mo-binding subunit
VDPETGQVRLRRLVAVHDVGTVINPLTHQGQIDGGVVQGIGEALIEELGIEDGRVTTLNLGEYKLPTAADIPPLTTVLVEAGSGPGPYDSKAIGEMSLLPTPAAIANAVYDACGVRLFSLPITAEKVWRALRERGGA